MRPAGETASLMPVPPPGRDLPALEDLGPVSGKRVLVRADFNVPMRRGEIVSDLRVRAATPTLQWLVQRGAEVTVCTHLGRPGGRRDLALSLDPVRERLASFVPGVRLLDNLRFDPGEEAADPSFVWTLVAGQDLYVNDAFASLHREHASVIGPPARLKSAAGRLVRREVELLSALREKPRRPFVAVLAGPPSPEHPGLVRYLLGRADWVVMAGPASLPPLSGSDPEHWEGVANHPKLILPEDFLVAAASGPRPVSAAGLPEHGRLVDTGRRTAERIGNLVRRAGTVFWDGPLGQIHGAGPASATEVMADAVAATDAYTVVSSVSAFDTLDVFGLSSYANHVSTGGSATLAFLRDGDLPGLRALRRAGG